MLGSGSFRGVVEAAEGKALVKVIIETSLLTEEEKIRACKLVVKAGSDYVKHQRASRLEEQRLRI